MTDEQRAARADFDRRRAERIRRQYAELNALDPDAYRRAIEAAGGIAINHELSTAAAADIESALVAVHLELAELRARVRAVTTSTGGRS